MPSKANDSAWPCSGPLSRAEGVWRRRRLRRRATGSYALAAGIPAGRKIVFSGVGKTREELAFALAQGVMQINVEVASELDVLSQLAAAIRA